MSNNKVTVVNPLTNRKITIGGKVYTKLLKLYYHDIHDNTFKLIRKIVDIKVNNDNDKINIKVNNDNEKIDIKVNNDSDNNKIDIQVNNTNNDRDYDTDTDTDAYCDKNNDTDDDTDKVDNPLTNRKIKIDGKVFKNLLFTHTFNKYTNKLIVKKVEIDSPEVEENCTICFENPPHKIMSCGHTCCYLCFYKMINSNGNKCHMCRHSLTGDLDFQTTLKNQTTSILNPTTNPDQIDDTSYNNLLTILRSVL
jgi:hypothetical protein